MSEFEIIQSIMAKTRAHPSVEIGPGDDCAVIKELADKSLVTSDTLMDGSHFILSEHSPENIAHKAVCANLSDIAAMGGTPDYMVMSLCLPKTISNDFCDRFFDKVFELCKTYDFGLAGGDTNSWQGPLVISITLVGRPHAKGPVLRSQAQPDDEIFVTGRLGGSIQGHHYQFTPRISLARQLLDMCSINSMIDLSDGLGGDLRHIMQASGVGAKLYKDKLPARQCLEGLSREEQISHILSDGEDFELCFTLTRSEAKKIEGWNCLFKIGIITASPGLFWQDGGEIAARGFEHMLDAQESIK